MILYISGTLEIVKENYIVVDNGGMGYRLFVSERFRDSLPAKGSSVKVFTYMYVKEDEISLYGFPSFDEREIFKVLLSISGVGPKAAMAVLSALTINELHLAVMSGDVKAITKANGIGTKGAQRIILELKDKLKFEDMIDAAYEQSLSNVEEDALNDTILALVSLGYSNAEALRAVRTVEHPETMDSGELLKAALKKFI